MKLLKLFLIFVLACSLQLAACSLVFPAGEDVTVSGDSKAQTVSLENAALPASGSEGEIRYNSTDDKLYVWDSAGWKLLSANKNVATKIVGVDRDRDGQYDTGDSLDAYRADYICDGTDDQQEINQAINEVANAAINPTQQGVVYLLEGTYEITDFIDMATGISLIGTGAGTALKLVTGTTNVRVISASSVNHILISQLMIDGNNKTGNFNIGVRFSSVTYSKIDKVRVKNMSLHGISLDSINTNNILSDNVVQSNGAYGIFLSSSSRNIVSSNTVQSNGVYGIYLSDSSDDNVLSANTVQSNATGIGLGLADNNILSGNNIQSSAGAGIQSSGSNNNILSGNNIQLNTGGAGIYYDSSNNNIISGNKIQLNAWIGITIFRSSNNNITANHISDNGDGYPAIKIDFDSDNNLISSNYIYDASGATGEGINVNDSSANANYLAANYISGFPTKISDSGSGTIYTGKEKITLEQVRDNSGNIRSDNSFVKLVSGVGSTLDNGKSSGDILIIQGPDTGSVTPTIPACTLHVTHPLSANDTLILIWNAAANAWLELSYTNN